jgi:sugar phosphate isomerase/epimerase
MKIGFSATGFQGKDFDTTVDCISRAGYQAIELDAAQLDLRGDAAYGARIREKLAAASLVAESLRVYGPENVVPGIKLATHLGVDLVATGIRAREGDREALEADIKRFEEWSAVGADYGVRLCVKPHVGVYLHDTPTMLEFMRLVDREQVGIMWDPSHLWRADENPAETLSLVKDYIFAVRLRDHRSREKAVDPAEIQIPGNGALDWPVILSQLATVNGLDILVIEINRMVDWAPEQMTDVISRARRNLAGFLRAV